MHNSFPPLVFGNFANDSFPNIGLLMTILKVLFGELLFGVIFLMEYVQFLF